MRGEETRIETRKVNNCVTGATTLAALANNDELHVKKVNNDEQAQNTIPSPFPPNLEMEAKAKLSDLFTSSSSSH